jgi:hypothetical protein
VHDRVGEHPPGAGVTFDDVARRRDLRVGEHIDVGAARRRGEQRDRGFRRTEHERGPRRAVDGAGIDRVVPTVGVGHAEEAGERVRTGPDPPVGIDEVGLHVDDRSTTPPERRVRRVTIMHRGLGDCVEPATVCGVDGRQRGRSCPAIVHRDVRRDRVVAGDRGAVGRRPRQRRVLVARTRAQQ